MKRDRKEKDFVQRAYFVGGTEALNKFIGSQMVYPEEAIENNIQGVVKLYFDIDYKGSVHHVKVISGLGYGCDEEAIRIAKLLKFKVPKTHNLKVGFKKKLNIHFRMKTEEIAASKPNYIYTYSPAPSQVLAYNYSISMK